MYIEIYQISPYQTKVLCILHFANGHAPGLLRGDCRYVLTTAKIMIYYGIITILTYVFEHIEAISHLIILN